MKMYKLITNYKGIHKKGTIFFVISESEFIGVKEFVLQSEEVWGKIIVTEEELGYNFVSLNEKNRFIGSDID
ncbi:hypothetical protein D0469_07120 [Peribacillus saganii]|uniref:Uncharacterized protein n=1 Tax=Peribacillus saganii TaxID=2303992 RepID=A0A372LQ76_9BACI|nr:hypothetical protein [Peribacillus saganii]RFU70365.1 hypothetical protein D0469_07120 [Peribacillus saganii]